MLNSLNQSNNIQSKNSKAKNKKFSISIYSNPFNVNFPYESNKITQNNISSMYKITSEKIQNLNPNITNIQNKKTISNLLSILHSKDSHINQVTNFSLRNNILIKNGGLKIKFPAKNSLREESYKHNKAISFNYKKSRDKSLKDKEKLITKIKMNISKISKKLNNFSCGKKKIKKKNIKEEKNKLIIKKENSFHERKSSITFRNISNKKKDIKEINKIPINTIINKIRKINSKKIPCRKNSNSKEKKDLSKHSNFRNTENTEYSTFKRDSSNYKNLFDNLTYSNEKNEFDKLENDLDSLVRKINFDNVKDNLNIFSLHNENYLNFHKYFSCLFDNDFECDV